MALTVGRIIIIIRRRKCQHPEPQDASIACRISLVRLKVGACFSVVCAGWEHACRGILLDASELRRVLVLGPHKGLFTLNPRELRGEMITTTLTKGQKGLGFTLVGNDGNTPEEEFLQIRTIIRDGPADKDGRLKMGK